MPVTGGRLRVSSFVLCAMGGVAMTAHAGDAFADPAAAGCGTSGRPWVAVHAPADLPRSAHGFVDLLRAELAPRGIDLCAETPSDGAVGATAPIATIEVSSSPDAVVLGVEVRDAMTEKHVSRDVSLGGVPADSQPLTIALAADELLRASWAELALEGAHRPSRAVPAEVTRTVRESIAPVAVFSPAPPRVLLGVDGAVEHFGSGTTLYGADARFAAWMVPRLAATLRAGLRSGATVGAPDGDVQPAAWLAGVGLQLGLTPPEMLRWGIDAVARIDLEHVDFTPTPRTSAVGVSGASYAVLAGVGAQVWLRVLPTLRIGAQAAFLLPLRPVDATDAHVEIAGVSGAGFGAQLGLWSTL